MPSLLYKTRAQTDPRGKPKVYFCCHPEDYALCFHQVTDELLKKQNCSLWYPQDPPAARSAAFWEELSRMQLFVMPVTARLLETDSIALEEFRFATKHHIPVLPLMQESGLGKRFNDRCGKLQYLDPTTRDETAISYDEKLERFLSSVLIGDELTEKIRAAFDAYVFLSYRKKDRKHARELMRLIHQNDFCRDIAIWYDEYLVPGENFNDAIRAALTKSQLFVLAVTPNLVNEVNYIQTTEYPMARENGKPILPAELVPTDRTLLARQYDGIPACTDAHDAPALSEALLSHLRQIAIAKNDGDEVHNYLIGLAYLSGIDVEVDHQCGVRLITSAAEHGLPEAIAKLVDMYRTGTGVERNYETAIAWQEALIRQRKEIFFAAASEINLAALVAEYLSCAEIHKDLGDTKRAKACYERADRYLEIFSERLVLLDNGRFTLQRQAFVATALGDSCCTEGDLAGANTHYQRALSLLRDFARPEDRESRYYLAFICNKLGDLRRAENDYAAARSYFSQSFAIIEELAEQTGDPGYRQALGGCCIRLGKLYRDEGDLAAAKAYYLRALSIQEDLALEKATADTRRDLAVTLRALGDLCDEAGNTEGNKAYTLRSLAIDEALLAENDSAAARRDVAIDCTRMGDICRDEGDLAGAKAYFLRSLAIDKALSDRVSTLQARRNLSIDYTNLGDILRLQGDLEGARAYLERSLALDTAAARTNTIQAQEDLAITYTRLALVCEAGGELSAAKTYYKRSLAISDELLSRTDSLKAHRDLSAGLDRLGALSFRLGDMTAADACFARSLALDEEILRRTDTPEARQDVASMCQKLGDVSLRRGELAAAIVHYGRCLSLREALFAQANDPDTRRELTACCIKLGDLQDQAGDTAAAKAHYRRAVTVNEAADSTEARQSLSLAGKRLGVLCENAGEIAEAKIQYLRTLHLDEALSKELDTDQSRYQLFVSCCNMGDIHMAEGDLTAAKASYRRCLSISDALRAQSDTAQFREAVAYSHRKLGEVCFAEKDLDTAQLHFRESLALWETIAAGSDPDYLRELYLAHDRVGTVYMHRHDPAACTHFAEALTALDAIGVGSPQLERDLFFCCSKLGTVRREHGDPAGATACFTRCLSCVEARPDQNDTETQYHLAVTYANLYSVDETGSDRYLRKAIRICKTLRRRDPHNEEYRQTLAFLKSLL